MSLHLVSCIVIDVLNLVNQPYTNLQRLLHFRCCIHYSYIHSNATDLTELYIISGALIKQTRQTFIQKASRYQSNESVFVMTGSWWSFAEVHDCD